jgi:arylsulfatase A-like enzyme
MGGPDRIGRTILESTPRFPTPRQPPAGAPNVVVIALDDLGFAQLGCFGSDIATPTFDRLAAGGLRYNRFHVTGMCSPTRGALLTGRNAHKVGMGFVADIPIGFPGYNGRIPASAAALPRVLKDAGYNTMAVGKWHLAPRWELSAAGPFDRWPLGLGFEHYYGFLGGDTNQWAPNLVQDNAFVDPPRTPAEGYHLTEDLVDRAIRNVADQRNAAPHRPFFLYLATGAMHAPHQAPASWIDRYRGHFDDGWERWRERAFARQVEQGVVPAGTTLTERPSWVRPWDDLPPEERRLYARMQEVFAGFLSHTDHHIGRLVAFLEQEGVLDDTLVLAISDNGTSAEGGPTGSRNEHRFAFGVPEDLADDLAHLDELGGHRSYNHYPWGWAWAGNAPLKLWKRYAWLGGTRTPLIVHWPRGVETRGQVRPQFCHAVDVAPTVLEAAGLPFPEVVDGVQQQPLDGESLLPTFADGDAPSPRSNQYFEIIASRSIYLDGWKATTDHVSRGVLAEEELLEGSRELAGDHWALYHLDEDFSEAHDRSADEPERVRQLADRWWFEAGRNQVLPLEDSLTGRFIAMEPGPPPKAAYTYRPGGSPVAEDVGPSLSGGFRIAADVEVPAGGGEGVLCAQGDWTNGWAFYVRDGRLTWVVNAYGQPVVVRADGEVVPGRVRLRAEYDRSPAGGGPVVLLLDDVQVGEGRVALDLPVRWQIGGAPLRIGSDAGFPVCDEYEVPFPWTGTLHSVTIEVGPRPPIDPTTEAEVLLKSE